MKSRWLSRGLVLSVALVSSIGVAACSRAQGSGEEAPQKSAAAAAEERGEAQRGPGHRMFRQIEALDLSEDQRDEIRDIEEGLTQGLSQHRETARQVAETLARGLETGTLDEREAARSQDAMLAAVAEARAEVVNAMNGVHEVLDSDQREALVEALKEQRAQRARGAEPGEGPRGGLAKLAAQLGLNEEQKQAIRDEIQAQIDKVVPDRKAKREAWEAKMDAMAEAFVSDDFDAADFDLGGGAEESIASFTATAKQAIDFTGSVLDPSQRALLASLLRARAEKL